MTGRELYERFDRLLAECWEWEGDRRVSWDDDDGPVAPLQPMTREAWDRLAAEVSGGIQEERKARVRMELARIESDVRQGSPDLADALRRVAEEIG